MNITPIEFLESLIKGISESELNKNESDYIDMAELKKLISKRYGHSYESATNHLLTDYSNGFTICGKCGSYYPLGKGFTKHLSNGCLHCEGEIKHYTYFHKGNNEIDYKTDPRYMSQMFDDGMHYCKDKLVIEKFKEYTQLLAKQPINTYK